MIIYLYAAIFFAAAMAAFGFAMDGAPDQYLPISVFSMFVAYGLFRKRRWTEHALFGAGLYIVVGWLVLASLHAEKWLDAPFFVNYAISVFLAAAYPIFWITMWLLVRRYFRSQVDHDELSSHFS